jgi:hypothetical protein
MTRAKVAEDPDAPATVKAHFDNLYRLEEVPSALIQVCILYFHVFHAQLSG